MVLALVGWGMVLALVVSNQPIPQHIPQQSTQPIDMIRVQQDIESLHGTLRAIRPLFLAIVD